MTQALYAHMNNKRKKTKGLCFFFFWAVQGFELRGLYLLGRCPTAYATHPAPFALVILEIGSCLLPRVPGL
jgi:hypothetical protein